MGDLTRNLSRHEMACTDNCGYNTVDISLATTLQDCADYFSAHFASQIYLEITGPNRCIVHNEQVQKAHNRKYIPYSSKSQHLYGKAADFKLFRRNGAVYEQIPVLDIARYLETNYPGKYGIGRYPTFIHLDVREIAARWGKV